MKETGHSSSGTMRRLSNVALLAVGCVLGWSLVGHHARGGHVVLVTHACEERREAGGSSAFPVQTPRTRSAGMDTVLAAVVATGSYLATPSTSRVVYATLVLLLLLVSGVYVSQGQRHVTNREESWERPTPGVRLQDEQSRPSLPGTDSSH